MAALPENPAPQRSSFRSASTTVSISTAAVPDSLPTAVPADIQETPSAYPLPVAEYPTTGSAPADSISGGALLPTEPLPASPVPTVSMTAVPQATAEATEPVAAAPVASPATAATAATTPVPPTPTPEAIIVLPTPEQLDSQARWRRQQQNRRVFDQLQTFITSGSDLWWYDPIQQQHVVLGRLSGVFDAQARFTLAGQEMTALEVPYHVNRQYGLTSLSPAFLERIRAAGYDEWIEAYVIESEKVQPY